MNIPELKNKANLVRRTILNIIFKSQSSHIGSAFSIVDILTVLYFEIMNIDPKNPKKKNRDHFILSKGHACTALYSTLAHRGFFELVKLDEYGTNGTKIAGHVSMGSLPGIEATAGSLGHGLPIGVGMALAMKRDGLNSRVFVLVGDGECNEGAVWEAAMSAGHFKLDNLVVVIDKNNQQGMGTTDEVLGMEPFPDKWKSFGWAVVEVDGHNFGELVEVLKRVPIKNGIPTAIIANTVKGKGVSFMEDKVEWHYKSPTSGECQLALAELK